MANLSIPDKSPGDTHTSAELDQQVNWMNSPTKQGTTFTDTGTITVDETVEYSTIRVVTGSTHTLAAATSGNVLGNYKKVRYTFNVDCTLTLNDFDVAGSQTGTIDPIPAGTYDFYFVSGAFGVWLGIKGNIETQPSNSPLLSNFNIKPDNLDRIYFNSDRIITASTYGGFTVASPAKTVSGITINSGNLTGHYFSVSAAFTKDDRPTIAYSGSGSDLQDATANALTAFNATDIMNILILDDFTGTTIDTTLAWDLDNTNSPNPDISQDDELIGAGNAGQGALTSTLTSKDTYSGELSMALDFASKTGNPGGWLAHIWIDNDNRITLAPDGDTGGGDMRLYIRSGASTVYTNESTGVTVYGNRFKIDIDSSNNIRFYYKPVSGGSWTEIDSATAKQHDIGSNKYIYLVLANNNTTTFEARLDAMRVTNQLYTSEMPENR